MKVEIGQKVQKRGGEVARIMKVDEKRIQVRGMASGTREWLDVLEFKATYHVDLVGV